MCGLCVKSEPELYHIRCWRISEGIFNGGRGAGSTREKRLEAEDQVRKK